MGSRSSKPAAVSWWDANSEDFDAVESELRADLQAFFDQPSSTSTSSPLPGAGIELNKPRDGVSVVKGGSIVVPPDPDKGGSLLPRFYGKLVYDTRHSERHTFEHLADSFTDELVARKCKAWLRNTSGDRQIEVSNECPESSDQLWRRQLPSCFSGGSLILLSLHRSYKSESEVWVFDYSVEHKEHGKLPSSKWRPFILREAVRIVKVSKWETEITVVSYLAGMHPRLHHLPPLDCFCHIADVKLVEPDVELFPLKGDLKQRIGLPRPRKVEIVPCENVQLWQVPPTFQYPVTDIRRSNNAGVISISRKLFYVIYPNYGTVRDELYLPYFA